MNKRKMKKEQVRLDLYEFEDSLETVRDKINGLIEQYGSNAKLESDYVWGYGCDDRDHFYHLNYEREETDAEIDKRLKAAAKAKERRKAQKIKEDAAKEAKELKELARLRKKCGE